MIDAPGRPQARFPASKEPLARALILERLRQLADESYEAIGIGSAAPGADILFHEAMDELGIKSLLCLPMPVKAYSAMTFGSLDAWRTRFLRLVSGREILELSDRSGLPRWLDDNTADPWERGSCWVAQLAETWGAKKVTLVAFWDGNEANGARGGTTQIVNLARNAGSVEIEIVDARRLLE